LVSKREFQDYVYVAERICGICSFMHGMGYSLGVERIMGIEVPERAQYIRTIYCELSRVHSHLLWLGLAADAFGFENLFMQSWRARETVLDLVEMTTGGRVIFGSCKVGGVRGDLDQLMLDKIISTMDEIERPLKKLTNVFVQDASVRRRLTGVGTLTTQQALDYGAVGPMLRASGVKADLRTSGYAAYSKMDFQIETETAGDCMARVEVRVREIYQSISIIRQAAKAIPAGDHDVKVTGTPNGETYVRVEQPRGEVVYFLRGDGTKFLERFRVRTPTFANIPAMVQVMQGTEFAHIPDIVLTIDPCISCTER
jgi:ech hydrogenase subunit E